MKPEDAQRDREALEIFGRALEVAIAEARAGYLELWRPATLDLIKMMRGDDAQDMAPLHDAPVSGRPGVPPG